MDNGSRESFLAQKTFKRQAINTSAGKYWIAVMTGNERDAYEQAVILSDNPSKARRGELLCRTIVNENGQRLFNDDDAIIVGNLPVDFIQPLYNLANKLNKISYSDIGELEKKSDSSQSEDSGLN